MKKKYLEISRLFNHEIRISSFLWTKRISNFSLLFFNMLIRRNRGANKRKTKGKNKLHKQHQCTLADRSELNYKWPPRPAGNVHTINFSFHCRQLLQSIYHLHSTMLVSDAAHYYSVCCCCADPSAQHMYAVTFVYVIPNTSCGSIQRLQIGNSTFTFHYRVAQCACYRHCRYVEREEGVGGSGQRSIR